jgi:mono/diheme cytochrome c family protein
LILRNFILVATGLFAACHAGAQPAAGKLDGADVFELKCQVCHGPNMVTPGGGVFDLRKFPLNDKERFVTSVLKGKNAMPAWQGLITAAEIDALWEYVQKRGKQ